ncbi:NAD(P)H-binding protein [Streptomyces himalayensis]|uniref:NAD(P)H-binding protein n=1 Tax=Streptomyces himalayensis subsp. himalayensis TaxID=2756131 RepID=A0A7W0DSL3_9ACTN|nr:NAD(P)H-binding protein [Streptomyces himalayensis]MBA2950482.1 NAD(P)H-binding protein [Streptomyces himalayensis subsp. himalayensis]
MIVVTGATGNVGRPLVRALVAAGEQVTAVSRRISASQVPAGVRYHQADLVEPENLKPVLDGAETLFLLTSGDFVAADGNLSDVLEVTRAGGIRRVVLLSSQGVSTKDHSSELEDAVTQSGMDWTMLRPGGFHSNTLQWADTVRAQRVVTAPFGDIALPTIDPADTAQVAAVALRDAAHNGNVYELTGPVAISPRQQAAAIADALGEPVRFVEQTRAEAKAAMVRFMPEPVAERTLDILGAPSTAAQRVSPDVELLLGRPARTFAEWATHNISAFQ